MADGTNLADMKRFVFRKDTALSVTEFKRRMNTFIGSLDGDQKTLFTKILEVADQLPALAPAGTNDQVHINDIIALAKRSKGGNNDELEIKDLQEAPALRPPPPARRPAELTQGQINSVDLIELLEKLGLTGSTGVNRSLIEDLVDKGSAKFPDKIGLKKLNDFTPAERAVLRALRRFINAIPDSNSNGRLDKAELNYILQFVQGNTTGDITGAALNRFITAHIIGGTGGIITRYMKTTVDKKGKDISIIKPDESTWKPRDNTLIGDFGTVGGTTRTTFLRNTTFNEYTIVTFFGRDKRLHILVIPPAANPSQGTTHSNTPPQVPQIYEYSISLAADSGSPEKGGIYQILKNQKLGITLSGMAFVTAVTRLNMRSSEDQLKLYKILFYDNTKTGDERFPGIISNPSTTALDKLITMAILNRKAGGTFNGTLKVRPIPIGGIGTIDGTSNYSNVTD